jgi:hypothetical protein
VDVLNGYAPHCHIQFKRISRTPNTFGPSTETAGNPRTSRKKLVVCIGTMYKVASLGIEMVGNPKTSQKKVV